MTDDKKQDWPKKRLFIQNLYLYFAVHAVWVYKKHPDKKQLVEFSKNKKRQLVDFSSTKKR